MINFEEELKRFKPMLNVDQTESAIYNNDMRDISDIVAQITEELRSSQNSSIGQINSRLRR